MPDDEHAPSRQARLEARRRRYRWAGLLAVVAILGGAATVAAFTSTDDAPAASRPGVLSAAPGGNAPSTTQPHSIDDVPVRPLSHAAPLRLWVGGDSLAGALGPALGTLTGNTGVVQTHVDYKVSSGLVPSVRDWQSYAAKALPTRNPEAVVFMIGTNDANLVNSLDANNDGVPDWEADYRNRVDAMMDLLIGGPQKRTVIWIGAPTMRDSARDKAVVQVNRVMQEEARLRVPHVLYFDAYKLFGGTNGKYADRLDTGESIVRVRIGDGVHFTPAGAEYLAGPIMAMLDARYHLTAQADPSQPIAVTMEQGGEWTSGSGGTTSGSRSGRSGSGTGRSGSSGTVRRSTPTTAESNSDDGGTPTTASDTPAPTAPPQTSPPPPATDPPPVPQPTVAVPNQL
jgi:hypothetical protein